MYELNHKLKNLTAYDPVEERVRIHLDANESFLPLPEGVLEEAKRALEETEFNRYPDASAKELCAAFADRYGVPAENVAAGNGSDELITLLFSAFLQKGEAFATVEPDFSMYAFNGFLQEARHVAIEKRDFVLDVDQVIETCNRGNVRLLIFSNPCNPTSLVCPREEMRRLIQGVQGLVVLDEAYMDFSDQTLLPEFQNYDNLVILRTCSKAVGLAGLRLGFAVGRRELIDALKAAKSPYNVNVLSQKLGTLILRRKEELTAAAEQLCLSLKSLRRGVEDVAAKHPGRFRLLNGETNFLSLLLPDGEDLRRFLWDRGISVRLTGGIFRVTCGRPEENEAFLRAFEDYFAKASR